MKSFLYITFLVLCLPVACIALGQPLPPASGAGWLSQDDPSIPKYLSVTLKLAKSRYEVGEAIPYVMTITNSSDKLIYLAVRDKPFSIGYSVDLVDGSAKPVSVNRASYGYSGMVSAEIPGKQDVVFTGFVNYFAAIGEPGHFTAKAIVKPEGYRSFVIGSATLQFSVEQSTKRRQNARLDAATKALDAAVSTDDKIRAVQVLGYTRDARAIPRIVQAGREEDLQFTARQVLFGHMDHDAVSKALIEELRNYGPSCSNTSTPITSLLSDLGDKGEESLPILRHWIEKGNGSQRASAVREIALRCRDLTLRFSDVTVDEATASLVRQSLHDPDKAVRKAAVQAVEGGQFGDTFNAVIGLIRNDPDEDVRGMAALSITRYRDRLEEAIPALQSLVVGTSESAAQWAAYSLQTIASPAARSALQDGQRNDNPVIQKYCTDALEKLDKAQSTQP
jgi:hypothetical protein